MYKKILIDFIHIIIYKKMPHPTFWFSNSGLNCSDFVCHMCCSYYKPLSTTDFEWDIHEGVCYTIVNIQPNYINQM